MKLKLVILAGIAALGLAAPAAAGELKLAQISSYLNDLKTVRAEFTQINDDGSISTGDLLISRPGRIRFQYDPPENSLVLAERNSVAVFDSKSNQPPDLFPLRQTPLNLILARKVDLSRERMVVAFESTDAMTTVTAQDPNNPEYGTIQLVFTNDPVQLRQWVVTDGAGQRTTLVLGKMVLGEKLPRSLFDIDQESRARGF
ncbi:MAG: outer membrane lipoprotein carrier protein LolA [Paracoccaceae bacterium]